MVDASWDQEGIFKNRPHTTLTFERQVDHVFHCLGEWDHEKKCEFMEQLLQVCSHMIFRFLWTVIEPVVHRDFVFNQFEPTSQSNFFTLSSYVTRELYSRLEKIVNKYKRKKRDVYRIPSNIVKTEDEVRYWTRESILPVIKGYNYSKVGSSTSLARLKKPHYSSVSALSLPTISSWKNMSFEKRFVKTDVLNRVPLRHQTKQRHLQRDEIQLSSSCRYSMEDKVFKSSHEISHMKQNPKTRSMSSIDVHSKASKEDQVAKIRSNTSLGIASRAGQYKEKCNKRQIIEWFRDRWNDWQRKEFLQKFVQSLDTSQIYLLYGLIMVRLYRDFISLLPRHLSIKILSYLSPAELLQVAKVCTTWEELASSDEVWQQKCLQRQVSYRTSVTWKDTYLRYENLDDNWRKGHCTLTEFYGHTASVTTVQFFKNLLASGSVDKTIKIWNLESGDLIQTLKGHSKGVWGLRFMSKTLLISCSNDQTIKIWNLRTGTCARTFLGHTGGVWCIQQKGDLLVSGSVDKTARIWNIRHCRMKGTLVGHAAAIFGIDFDPDKGFVFTGSADKTIRMWNMRTMECLRCILVSATSLFPITCIGYYQVCFSLYIALHVLLSLSKLSFHCHVDLA